MLTFLLGGYEASSMVIIWSLHCPLLGLLHSEPSTALRWFYLFIVANGLALGAQGSLMGDPASPIDWRNNLAAFNVIGIGSLLFLGLRYFFNQRQVANAPALIARTLDQLIQDGEGNGDGDSLRRFLLNA